VYRNVLISIIMALTSLVGTSGTASAADNSGNPAILKAVNNLQTSVNALQSTVNSGAAGISTIQSALAALQQSVNSIGSQLAPSNVRFTAPADLPLGDLGSCIAVNVSVQARTIAVQILNLDGQVAEDLGTAVVQPGHSAGGGNRQGDFFYCKFTVVDGTRNDIRGSMTVCTAGPTGVCKQTISAD